MVTMFYNHVAAYHQHQLKEAVTAVRKGQMSYRKAGQHFGVPYATVHDNVQKAKNGVTRKRQGNFALTEAQEDAVADYCKESARHGWPLRRKDISVNISVKHQ